MGPVAEVMWRRFYYEIDDHEEFKMSCSTNKVRVAYVFSADGIRHDRNPRLLVRLQLSSAFMLMGVIGNYHTHIFHFLKYF
jgi:hypothetical protein